MNILYDHCIRLLPKSASVYMTGEEDKLLKEQGDEGWELCAVNAEERVIKYYFKRIRQHIVLLNDDGIADWASDHLPKDGQ
jgi:hypothetical protein